MKSAKWIFRFVGILGLLIIVPFYFTELQSGADVSSAITQPDYYYGFLGVTLAWQIAFLIISTDPLRYRPLMIAGMVEKASYAIAMIWLFAAGRVPTTMLGAGIMDLVLGILIVIAYIATGRAATAQGGAVTWQAR